MFLEAKNPFLCPVFIYRDLVKIICWATIGSGNVLGYFRRQAITYTNIDMFD